MTTLNAIQCCHQLRNCAPCS